jgi:hypothetical protein
LQSVRRIPAQGRLSAAFAKLFLRPAFYADF